MTFDGSGSSDLGGTIDSYEWIFNDGTTGTGQTIYYTYSTAGSYTVTLTVTDNGGGTDSDTAVVTVTEEPIIEDPTNLMHIDSLTMSSDNKIAGKNTFIRALATLTVIDGTGMPVPNAVVSGSWSDATSDSDISTTDTSGMVTVRSNNIKVIDGTFTFTFTVTDVVLTDWEYDTTAQDSGSITVTV